MPRRDLDPHIVLGVPRGASLLEIARARRRLAKQFHPDVAAGQSAGERMQAVNDAWRTLSAEHRRTAYAAREAAAPRRSPNPDERWQPAGAATYRPGSVAPSAGRTGWYVLAAMSLFLVLILIAGLVAAADGPSQRAPYAPIHDNIGP